MQVACRQDAVRLEEQAGVDERRKASRLRGRGGELTSLQFGRGSAKNLLVPRSAIILSRQALVRLR